MTETTKRDIHQTGTFDQIREKAGDHDIFQDGLKLIQSSDYRTRMVGISLAIFESRHKDPNFLPKYIDNIQFDEGKEVLLMILNKYEGSVQWTILENLMERYKSPVVRNLDNRIFPGFLFVLNNIDLNSSGLLYSLDVINEILSSPNAPRTIIFLVKSSEMKNESQNDQIVEDLKTKLSPNAFVTARTQVALKHLFAGDTRSLEEI